VVPLGGALRVITLLPAGSFLRLLSIVRMGFITVATWSGFCRYVSSFSKNSSLPDVKDKVKWGYFTASYYKFQSAAISMGAGVMQADPSQLFPCLDDDVGVPVAARRQHDGAPTRLGGGLDGGVDRRRVEGDAVALGAVVADVVDRR